MTEKPTETNDNLIPIRDVPHGHLFHRPCFRSPDGPRTYLKKGDEYKRILLRTEGEEDLLIGGIWHTDDPGGGGCIDLGPVTDFLPQPTDRALAMWLDTSNARIIPEPTDAINLDLEVYDVVKTVKGSIYITAKNGHLCLKKAPLASGSIQSNEVGEGRNVLGVTEILGRARFQEDFTWKPHTPAPAPAQEQSPFYLDTSTARKLDIPMNSKDLDVDPWTVVKDKHGTIDVLFRYVSTSGRISSLGLFDPLTPQQRREAAVPGYRDYPMGVLPPSANSEVLNVTEVLGVLKYNPNSPPPTEHPGAPEPTNEAPPASFVTDTDFGHHPYATSLPPFTLFRSIGGRVYLRLPNGDSLCIENAGAEGRRFHENPGEICTAANSHDLKARHVFGVIHPGPYDAARAIVSQGDGGIWREKYNDLRSEFDDTNSACERLRAANERVREERDTWRKCAHQSNEDYHRQIRRIARGRINMLVVGAASALAGTHIIPWIATSLF